MPLYSRGTALYAREEDLRGRKRERETEGWGGGTFLNCILRQILQTNRTNIQCTWDQMYINILVGKPEGKESIRRAGRRCEDVKLDLKETMCGLDPCASE